MIFNSAHYHTQTELAENFPNIAPSCKIHRHAMVDINAKLAENVHIDAYASIGANVIIGEGSSVGKFTIVEGHTQIGRGNKIGHQAIIGGPPQDMKYQNEDTKLFIGDFNTVREFVSIHTGTTQGVGHTTIGSHNWIMSYVHIAHDCQLKNHIILSNNAQLAGHVEVDDYAIIGGMSGIHQFVRIGQHAILGGASSLVQDLPPYIMAAGQKATPHGINQVGLARRDFKPEVIQMLKQAYRVLYRESLTLEEAKQEIKTMLHSQTDEQISEHLSAFFEFISSTQRGLIRP